ncbi:MAG TPA: hypothetical protein VMU36_07525 [Spirochaetia bacterium]|nr:hypothetical protein [Spirochaetia bacterium]
MDHRDAYAAASELALTGRYHEARDALLESYPSDIQATILLGKVEYCLRNPAASRRCFEAALSREPGNMAAFFGIEYDRQRARLLFLAACVVLLLAAIAGTTAFLAHRLTSSMRQVEARVDQTSAAFSRSVDRVGSAVEEIGQDSLGEHKNTEKALSEIQAELEKLRRGNVNLMREIEDLRKAAHQPPPASP